MAKSKAQRHRLAAVRALAPLRRRQPDQQPEEVTIMSDGLESAARALDSLGAGETPDCADVVCGALALDTLAAWGRADRDLLDAAAGLRVIAAGGSLDLDGIGRRRARALAVAVRAMGREDLPAVSRSSHFS
jgi:hypothetical protein